MKFEVQNKIKFLTRKIEGYVLGVISLGAQVGQTVSAVKLEVIR